MLRLCAPLLALLLLGCRPPASALHRPEPPLPDGGDPVALLQAYLRIDTSNPPGRELAAARFLGRVLAGAGIEHEIFDLGGGRANLRAVLRGDGARRPLVLLHHSDVVPAAAERWRRAPPFAGRIVGGELVGRGTLDIKGKGAIDVATLIGFKRRGPRLGRDLVLLVVADEEGDSIGARRLLAERPQLVRGAEYLVDEGMSVRLGPDGRPLAYLVSVGEKAPLWLTLRFHGPAGHASIPRPASALGRAVRAAARLLEHRTPVRLLPELRAWVKLQLRGRDLGGLPGAAAAGGLDAALERRELLEALAERDPKLNAALRDTIAVTGLSGSDKVNVISSVATVRVDCRLLPGSDKDAFLRELRRVLADPGAGIEVDQYYPPSLSPATSGFFRALTAVAARRDPGVPVVPTILVASTDASLFRAAGVQAYGFEPYAISEAQAELSHSDDERLSVASLRQGAELLRDLILELDRR